MRSLAPKEKEGLPVANFDRIIRNGTVYDGSGREPAKTDLGIVGDRITTIGDLGRTQADTVIDASGLAVAPGFIDIHTHSDFFSLLAPGAESKVTSGITTELLGNCGGSAFPLRGDAKARAQQVYGDYGLSIEWEDIDGYFTCAEEVGYAGNRACLVGHGTLRALAVGYDDRAPSEGELDEMKRELAECLERGAVGLSTGLIYPPGCYAETEEIIELAKVVARYDGLYASHVRGEAERGVQAIEEHLRITREAGVRSEIAHIKCAGRDNWGILARYRELIESARSQGVDVTADRYPYVASATSLNTIFPDWLHAGGTEAELARLQDADTRERLRRYVQRSAGDRADEYWAAIMIAYVSSDRNKHLEGLRMDQVAESMDRPAVEAAMDLLIDERCKVSCIFFQMSEENLKEVYTWPFVMVGSDAGVRSAHGATRIGKPHPRAFGTSTRFLGRYVREARVVSLAEAVRKLTSLPAQRIGLDRRGLLQSGYFADVVVFDPEAVIDRATFEDPFQYSLGIVHVLVNGVPVIQDGKHLGGAAGCILRRGQ